MDLKNLTILIVIMVLSLVSNAQMMEMKLTVKGGLNYSNVFDTRGENFSADPAFGFVLGGSLSLAMNKSFGIQPEALYSQKRFHAQGNYSGEAYKFTRTAGYFEFPLLLQIKPFKFLSLVAGPQYSYLSGTRDDFTEGQLTGDQQRQITADNDRRNIFGLVSGADILFKHFLLSGRACWDLTMNGSNSASYSPRYKNKLIQVTIGYRF